MNLIRLIFEIVRKFVPMDPNEYAQMRSEAEEWESKLKPDSENALEKFYCKYGRVWWFKLFNAVMYMYLLARIPIWINPNNTYEEEDEE
jgi:hypothetical protein